MKRGKQETRSESDRGPQDAGASVGYCNAFGFYYECAGKPSEGFVQMFHDLTSVFEG